VSVPKIPRKHFFIQNREKAPEKFPVALRFVQYFRSFVQPE
jgi:hypothetical protein